VGVKQNLEKNQKGH